MSCENSILDRDQTITVHDFGPRGRGGTVTVNLTYGLQPGAMLGIVVLGDQQFNINILDPIKRRIFQLDARVTIDQVGFNSHLEGKWGVDEIAPKKSIVKGTRASVTILYETDGYRIFINGNFVLFYKHRSDARCDELQIVNAQVFKVIYNTTVNIIP